jgi:DNA-binding CsgD family transcriptional regulator
LEISPIFLEVSPWGHLITAPQPAIYFAEAERKILPGVISGRGYKEIAARLAVSEKTVQFQVSSLCRKLKLNGRAELQIWCSQNPEDVIRGVTRNLGLHPEGCCCGREYCAMRSELMGIAA